MGWNLRTWRNAPNAPALVINIGCSLTPRQPRSLVTFPSHKSEHFLVGNRDWGIDKIYVLWYNVVKIKEQGESRWQAQDLEQSSGGQSRERQ